jgi:hypothetical protein
LGGSLVDEIHRRVGRNLLAFQAAEESLRFVLPYIHPDGSKNGADALRDYAERNVAKKPLGLLIDQFAEAAEGDKQPLVQDLEAFVIARNELVHHFYRNPSFNLTSPDGASAAVAYLDQQYEQAREWVRIFRAQVAAVLLALMESNPKLAAELAPHRDKLMAQLSRSPDSEEADFVIE